MKYMLDTNICIYVIKHKPEAVIKRFFMHFIYYVCGIDVWSGKEPES